MFSLPALSPATSLPTQVDAVVVGLADSSSGPVLVGAETLSASYAKRTGSSLLDAAQAVGATTKPGDAVVLPSSEHVVIVAGLGDADVTPERVRKAAAAALKRACALASDREMTVALSLDLADPEIVAAATYGALLATYHYAKPNEKPSGAIAQVTLVAPKDCHTAASEASVVAEAVALARDWVNTPANVLFPASFAQLAAESVRSLKLDVEVLDEKALAKGGFGGLMAVGGGSANPPRLVRITYSPRGAKTHLALIGKGITFDTGGLNLKPATGMYTMKCDMGGAAAVLAAVRAIAQLGLKIKVSAYAAMAENMPSGTAYRPSDVLTMHSGLTVENANSDAEGRLVMADALSYAGESKPDFMVDVATLTGACLVALGHTTTGLMANDDQAADRLLDAAEAAGEATWHLPITDEVTDGIKDSDVADLKSSGAREGGALAAAAFLREFVPQGTPWAHLDIAGPGWAEKAHDEVSKGGTGAGVRTLVELARQLAR